MGIRAERIDIDENAPVEHNARAIADEIQDRRATGRRYIVVSASKSGPEVGLALAMLSAEEAAHVAAWVNIAGVLGGSPLVDNALGVPRCWAALALFGWRGWGLDGMSLLPSGCVRITPTSKSRRRRDMRITSKGQVTIPVEIREKAGLLPDTEVEFELDAKGVRIWRARAPRRGRGAAALGRLRGRATVKMSTDEIMALTRPE